MQPQPLEGRGIDPEVGGVGHDHLRDHGHHFPEDLPALLDKELVHGAFASGSRTVQEAEVVADIVREHGLQAGSKNVPAPGRIVRPLDDHRRGDVAEDEVAVTITEVEVARGDLGIHHQHRPGGSGGDVIRSGLDAEGGRGTGHVHVEAEALDPQGLLDLDSTDHGVDLRGVLAPAGDGVLRRRHADLGHDRQLVVRALRDQGVHDFWVNHTRTVHHIAGFDSRGLLDELDGRGREGLDRARRDLPGMTGVEQFDVGVEGLNQLCVGDPLGGGEEAGGRDDRCVQNVSPLRSGSIQTGGD